MFNPERPINSRWETTKGKWNGKEFVSQHIDITFHVLIMVIEEKPDRTLLHFRNGPTGYETYNLADLDLPSTGEFPICVGTVNSWPACYVDCGNVKAFIREYESDKAAKAQAREAILGISSANN